MNPNLYLDISTPEKYIFEPAPRKAALIPYVNKAIRKPKPAVIICPGGGYFCLSYAEGEPVARRFQSYGIQAFLLQYSIGNPYPAALRELAYAMNHVRNNAEKYHIDPHAVFICGFSAGGHLAASLAVHGGKDWTAEHDFPENCIPDGLILCYPVTGEPKSDDAKTYQILRESLKAQKLEPMLHVDKYVTEQMPRTFLWHTVDDEFVPVDSSLHFLEKLKSMNVSFEAHFFPKGGHLLSLADESSAIGDYKINRTCAQWFGLALDWIHSFTVLTSVK